jgi:predicted ArsR family transcriptional regulator
MNKENIIEKLEGIIEITKGMVNVSGDQYNMHYIEEIEALNYAVESIQENEKLKSKVTSALNTLAEETMQKVRVMGDKQELVEALCKLIEMTRYHVIAANSYHAFDNAVNVVRKHITDPVALQQSI